MITAVLSLGSSDVQCFMQSTVSYIMKKAGMAANPRKRIKVCWSQSSITSFFTTVVTDASESEQYGKSMKLAWITYGLILTGLVSCSFNLICRRLDLF